jgi:hypothetical protein
LVAGGNEVKKKKIARRIRAIATNIRTGCVLLPAVKLFSKRMTDESIIPLTGASCISSFWADCGLGWRRDWVVDQEEFSRMGMRMGKVE